jgi:uncharacterized damage-inducible protein DinB
VNVSTQPEVWLRGPVAGVPPLLQPVAHGLMQCREEVRATLSPLSAAHLEVSPSGAATVGYHVRHAIGSLDRLLTYARGELLTPTQLDALRRESAAEQGHDPSQLAALFHAAIERALEQLRGTDEGTLLDVRKVGRAQLPSTVIGLLFHAAEHTQRHVGQMVTTAKIVSA